MSKTFVIPANEEFFKKFCTSMFNSFIESLKTCDFGKKYLKKLQNWASKCYDFLIKSTTYNEEEFSVFCHSDLWVNNFMFAHDENENPVDILFVCYNF